MGLSHTIEISSDGMFTVTNNLANKSVIGELPVDELAKLEEQVMALESIPTSRIDGMNCADCFVYDLEVHKNAKRFAVQLNDITLPGSGYELFIGQLLGLMDKALE
jgi:DNA-directed RNA polymerase specialized sigma54-like protein